MDIGSLKVIRGVQGGIPLYYQGHAGSNRGKWLPMPETDKTIALKGIEGFKGSESRK